MSKCLVKKRLCAFTKRSSIERNTRQDWSRFLDVSDLYVWFWIEINPFQTGKSEFAGQRGLKADCVPLSLCSYKYTIAKIKYYCMFSKLMRSNFDMQRNYRNLWRNDFVAKLPLSILPAGKLRLHCRIMHFYSSFNISSTVEPPLSDHPLLSGQ